MSEFLAGTLAAECVSDGDAAYEGMRDRREKLREYAKKLRLHEDDLEVFLTHGFRVETVPPLDNMNRRNMLAYLKKKAISPPKWLLISQLWPELVMTSAERRARVRNLYKATVALIRRELARRDADPLKGERSIFWDPIADVCRELEIAPSKLSALCKEFSGHALSQVVDCVRVERVRKLMRAELKEFVRTLKNRPHPAAGVPASALSRGERATTQCATLETEKGVDESEPLDRWAVWKALKASRKWPDFSQNIWANGLGFSTYRRLYRACVAVYGKTPHQIEMEMIEEFLKEDECSGAGSATDDVELSLEEMEEAVRGIRAYGEENGGDLVVRHC